MRSFSMSEISLNIQLFWAKTWRNFWFSLFWKNQASACPRPFLLVGPSSSVRPRSSVLARPSLIVILKRKWRKLKMAINNLKGKIKEERICILFNYFMWPFDCDDSYGHQVDDIIFCLSFDKDIFETTKIEKVEKNLSEINSELILNNKRRMNSKRDFQ